MESWITWIIQGLVAAALGGLCWFMKRTLTQFEATASEQKTRLEKLEERLNNFINTMPYQYTLRDDFIRTVAQFDSKLDKILDRLNK